MKTKLLQTTLAVLALSAAPLVYAEEKKAAETEHEHTEECEAAHSDIAAPNGGRILTDIQPHAEFLVTKEGKIQITFLDEEGKTVAPAKQTITIVTGKRSSPTKLAFEKTESGFLSTSKLPEGRNLPAIVQIKMTPESKAKTIRFNINLADCPTCDYLEYACTCDHGEDGHE